jgi:hypothetical protein
MWVLLLYTVLETVEVADGDDEGPPAEDCDQPHPSLGTSHPSVLLLPSLANKSVGLVVTISRACTLTEEAGHPAVDVGGEFKTFIKIP